jgi:hypothetical protein
LFGLKKYARRRGGQGFTLTLRRRFFWLSPRFRSLPVPQNHAKTLARQILTHCHRRRIVPAGRPFSGPFLDIFFTKMIQKR